MASGDCLSKPFEAVLQSIVIGAECGIYCLFLRSTQRFMDFDAVLWLWALYCITVNDIALKTCVCVSVCVACALHVCGLWTLTFDRVMSSPAVLCVCGVLCAF